MNTSEASKLNNSNLDKLNEFASKDRSVEELTESNINSDDSKIKEQEFDKVRKSLLDKNTGDKSLKQKLLNKLKNNKKFDEYMNDANINFTGLERRRLKIDTVFGNDVFSCYFLQSQHPELVLKGSPKVHEYSTYSVLVQSTDAFVYRLPVDFFKFLLSYEKGPLLTDLIIRDVPNLKESLNGRKHALLSWLGYQEKLISDMVKKRENDGKKKFNFGK